jgi:hypothetical protein
VPLNKAVIKLKTHHLLRILINRTTFCVQRWG